MAAFALAATAAGADVARDLDEEPFEVTADTIEFDGELGVYVAEGHVQIDQPGAGRRLDADWVAFSRETRRGVASGDVTLQEEDSRIDAEFIVFDIDTLEVIVFDGELDTGADGFRLAAGKLVRVDDVNYEVEEGAFTTCRCPDPDERDPWTIRTEDADIEIGEYGYARNVLLEVLDVPVVWLPLFVFPVKTERESGLLLPEFSFGSRNGFEIGVPVFFALGDPVNLTLTPRWLSKRGFKQDAELEYVFGEKSRGRVYATWLRDQEIIDDDDSADDYNRNNLADIQAGLLLPKAPPNIDVHRWAFEYESRTWLPGRWQLVTDIHLVSDNDFPDDFDDLQEFRRDRFLESTVFGYRSFGEDGRFGALGGIRFADDLQSPDDVDRDDFLLQRMPEVALDQLRTPFSELALVTGVDVEYANFWAREDVEDSLRPDAVRVDGLFFDTGIDVLPSSQEGANKLLRELNAPLQSDPNQDDTLTVAPFTIRPEGDGEFQEGEPLADRGHRIVLRPRIGRSFELVDGVEFYPEVTYAENLYLTDRKDFRRHGVVSTRAELSTRLLGRTEDDEGRRVSHLVEPRLRYVMTEALSQSGDPFFVVPTFVPQTRIRQLEPETVVDDPADRVADGQRVVLSVANKIFRTNYAGREELLADVTVSGNVDPENGAVGELVLDGTTSGVLFANSFTRSRFNLVVDPDHGRVDEGLFEVGLASNPDWPVVASSGLRYRYLRKIPRFFESFQGANSRRFNEFSADFNRISQVEASIRLDWGPWIGSYKATYSFEDEILITNSGGLDYVSRCRCWAVGVQISDDRARGVQYQFRYTLLGFGDDRRRPFVGAGMGSADELP